ncbi:SgcJ/EcaC family oxidoreductase [Sphingopyxis sp. GW247-27LB]|uniref:YybH family protein n=1 Tax=Sphingopyxis sp. GW247-27LB TaxID=2012632 RepID=UPI000BA51D8E|nr:SgcJ/EcaC family oxidoreductase [Sphingopyxis sp. GW247-27LB]PAL24198.1 hypothetical protein CD928_04635 [Sphingopyxis sp. GW247-27LB]
MTVIAGEVLHSWQHAFHEQDVDALVDLYTAEALFLGSQPTLLRGSEGIHDYFTAVFASGELRVTFENLEVEHVADDVFILAVRAIFSSPSRGELEMRLTQTLLLRNGRWRIACHHVSPAG